MKICEFRQTSRTRELCENHNVRSHLPIKLYFILVFLCRPFVLLMSAFGEIARRIISSLPQCDVDIILSFASNELHRDANRPLALAIQTYVVFHPRAEHAAATLTWLRASRQGYKPPVEDAGGGDPPRCELCGDYHPDVRWVTVFFADLAFH